MNFEEAMKEYGHQITCDISLGGKVYGEGDILSVTPHYEGALLTSVMRCIDIELIGNVNIRAGSNIDVVRFGVKGNEDDEWHFKEYKGYVVYSSDYSAEGKTTLECYDALLRSMIPYDLNIDFSNITLKEYLETICARLGYTLKSGNFVNADVILDGEKYSEKDTFRTALDEIAAAAGGTIIVQGTELSVIYPSESGVKVGCSDLKSLTFKERVGPINTVVLSRTPQEDNVYRQNSEATTAIEIRIENNQLMDSHREDFIDGILESLSGLEYTAFEANTFGIGALEFGDMFEIESDDGTCRKVLLLSDEFQINTGVSEKLYAEAPEKGSTDYKAAESALEKAQNRTEMRVDKQEQQISAVVSRVEFLESGIGEVEKSVTELTTATEKAITVGERYFDGVKEVNTGTGFVFDKDGLHVNKTGAETEGTFNETGLKVTEASSGDTLLFAGYDGEKGESVVETKNLSVEKYFSIGKNARFEDYADDRTGCFYIGGEY